MMIPVSFFCFTISIGSLLRNTERLPDKTLHFALRVLASIPFAMYHELRRKRSASTIKEQNGSIGSSANNHGVALKNTEGMSFKKTINRKEPKSEYWGTPLKTGRGLDISFRTMTIRYPSEKKDTQRQVQLSSSPSKRSLRNRI